MWIGADETREKLLKSKCSEDIDLVIAWTEKEYEEYPECHLEMTEQWTTVVLNPGVWRDISEDKRKSLIRLQEVIFPNFRGKMA